MLAQGKEVLTERDLILLPSLLCMNSLICQSCILQGKASTLTVSPQSSTGPCGQMDNQLRKPEVTPGLQEKSLTTLPEQSDQNTNT